MWWKKVNSVSGRILHARIYLDQLRRIIEILNDNCERVEISDKNYKYSDIDDLIDNNKDIPNVSYIDIHGYGPFIHIDVDREETKIYASDNSVKSTGIFTQLEKILRENIRKSLYIRNGYVLLVYFIAMKIFQGIGDLYIDKTSYAKLSTVFLQ